MPKLPSERFKI